MSRARARRTLAGAAAATLGIVIIATAGGPTASAHHKGVQEICGSPYTADKHPVPIRKNAGQGPKIGRLVLVKHRRSDTYCGVTIRRHHERKKFTLVKLDKTRAGGVCSVTPPTGCKSKRDAKRYRSFAGPRYFTLGNGCIRAEGFIAGAEIRVAAQVGDCS
jgi:hypothetical protein